MSRFREAVQCVKNRLKINNVYDCARPLLVLIGLFGVGGTWIGRTEGVYTLQNSKISLIVFILVALVFTPFYLKMMIVYLFTDIKHDRALIIKISFIMYFFVLVLNWATVCIGCIRTHVYCKRLETIFQLISNVDSQLEQANIRVKHWKITLKVMVLTLISADYSEIMSYTGSITGITLIMISIMIHLLYMWTILFLLIIHERFVGLNTLLQENATLTNIQVVGERNPRDNYILRRITLVRHVHEQLTEVVQLFTDICRYVIIGLTVLPIITSEISILNILVGSEISESHMHSLFIQVARITIVIIICQANKAERRVLSGRLRHLVAFETDRDIVRQVQQYIMYNAYSAPGLIDFQLTDIDNSLLLTIIDLIVSNALIIFSYTREGIGLIEEESDEPVTVLALLAGDP